MKNIKRKITVYNKSMKRIAEFSNSTVATTPEAQKNIMASPTVTMVSNGESKLTFTMLANSTKWQTIKDPENIYECGDKLYTALNKNSIVYEGDTVSATLVETWYLLSRVFVQAHNVNTKIEAIDEHTVKILPKTDKKFKLTINGVAYEDSQVTDQRGVQMPRGSAGYALWAILKGTDWKLGICDVLPKDFNAAEDYGTFNVETDMKDVLYNIRFVQQLYGGILVWDSINKTVSLRDETKEDSDFNKWKGFSIRKKKNLTDPPKVTFDNDIITRVYPLGNGNLNIRKVNNGKSYIENFSYTKDVYEGYIQNANIYNTGDEGGQKTLKFWAEQQLGKICKPRKSIEYNIIDLRSTPGYEHETFDVNDVVKAYYMDEGKEVWEYVRIQELSYNYFFPSSDSVVVVGDKVANKTEIFHQIYKKQENSAPTDNSGNLSADDIYIEIPDFFLDDFGYLPDGFGYASLQTITNLHAEHETKNTKAIADLRVYADDTFATITSFTSFKEWTETGLKKSSTRIDQVSTALYAQIDLEAKHYEESLKYAKESVANLRLYVDGDFAQAQLRAAYAYSDSKTNQIANSLSEFEAYANREYARTSQLASYTTYDTVKGIVNNSEAGIKSWASNNFASVSIAAKVNQMYSGINVSSSNILIAVNVHQSSAPGYINIDSGGRIVIRSAGGLSLLGSDVHFNSAGYLVRY